MSQRIHPYQIQAYLDGELSGAEARQVEQWLQQDPQGEELRKALAATRALLRANEPAPRLPVTHDFFWNQVRQRLEAQTAVESQPAGEFSLWGWLRGWRRFYLPVSAMAVVALLAIGLSSLITEDPDRYLVEVENLSGETDSTTFRYQSEKMFVVWISSKEVAALDDRELEPGMEEGLLIR